MNTATIKITAVERKEGFSQKTQKPWTKFIVHAEGGGEYATFDMGISGVAFASVGQQATLTFETGQYGNDLKGLVPIVGQTAPGNSDFSPPTAAPPFTPAASNGDRDWDLIGLRKTRCALWAALFQSGMLKGVGTIEAAHYCALLVKAAEEDIFHRSPAQKDDGIPF